MIEHGAHSHRYAKAIRFLKEARKSAGMTQTQLAELLGTRQQFVSKYESGERRLDVIEFLDVAEALGADIPRLIAICTSHSGELGASG